MFKSILVALALILSSLSFVTPASAAPVSSPKVSVSIPAFPQSVRADTLTSELNCSAPHNKVGLLYGDEVNIRANVIYKTCKQGTRRWVRLISHSGSYTVKPGHHLTCNRWAGGTFVRAIINPFFSDSKGNKHNPDPYILGCKTSGKHFRLFKAGTAPKLYWLDGVKAKYPPRWQFTIKEELSSPYSGIPDNVVTRVGNFSPNLV